MSTTRTATLPVPSAVLRDIAAGLAAAEPFWRGALEVHPDARGHVRIVATDAYEAWLISWPIGHGVELHDHGGSTGAIAIAEGELVEVTARGDGTFARTVLPTDSTHDVAGDCIHDVLNLAEAPAVSIHVYSPPLSTMTFYDESGELPLRTEHVYPEPAVAPSGEVARVLHPSARPVALG